MTPEALKAARTRAGLTQTQAGALVFAPLRTYQDWEYGIRKMPAAKQELFKLKIKASVADAGDGLDVKES